MRFGEQSLPDRFWERVMPEPMSGCWLWTARLCHRGYGRFDWQGKGQAAHRVAKLAADPGGVAEAVDHKCLIRCCVNPDHTQWVTHSANSSLRHLRNAGIGGSPNPDTCYRGHARTEHSVVRPYGVVCRECQRVSRARLNKRSKGTPSPNGFASGPRAISKERQSEVLRLIQSGMNRREIARTAGVSGGTVDRVASAAGLAYAGSFVFHPVETRAKALNMRRSGLGPLEISRELGLNVNTVRTWCKRAGIQSRRGRK